MTLAITIPEAALVAFCQRRYIRKLWLYGSALRPDFRPNSDVDVLVEFDSEHIPGWEIVSIAEELSTLFGYPIDLATPRSHSLYIRDQVMASAQVVYDAER